MDTQDFIESLQHYGTVRPYSGRGMFGKQCVGFEPDGDALLAIAKMMADTEDEDERYALLAHLERHSRDSLGRGEILYFPLVAWPEGMRAEVEDAA